MSKEMLTTINNIHQILSAVTEEGDQTDLLYEEPHAPFDGVSIYTENGGVFSVYFNTEENSWMFEVANDGSVLEIEKVADALEGVAAIINRYT